jgi:hypothetical protein
MRISWQSEKCTVIIVGSRACLRIAGATGYDGAGVSEDGKTIVYSHNRVVGDVYLLEGLK